MSQADTVGIFPPGGLAAPKERRGQGGEAPRLPPNTVVFSADDHLDLSEDIWYERFPASMKDRAPRVWYAGGVYHFGHGGKSYLPYEFEAPLAQYDDLPGSTTGHLDERMADLSDEGIEKELAFPNNVLVMMGQPDREVRELCFRIYNEYLAELQARAPGRFHGVGIINWWDPKGARRTLAECKALGLKTFFLPTSPGTLADGITIDWGSRAMTPVWDEIADSGLPVSHHIGESPRHCEFNSITVGFMHNAGSFREMFAKYIFGGILDRHPTLRVGWFEAGINWIPSVLQDAEHAHRAFQHMHNWKLQNDVRHYWDKHMCASFIVDPLGLQLLDTIGADKALWSADYPHNESTFGFSKNSIASVIDTVGDDRARAILGGNIMRFLNLEH